MTRLIGDQLQQHEPKLAALEHPAAAAAVAAARTAAFRPVADVEMNGSPVPAAPAAHCEQALRNVDFNMASRAASVAVAHKISFDVS